MLLKMAAAIALKDTDAFIELEILARNLNHVAVWFYNIDLHACQVAHHPATQHSTPEARDQSAAWLLWHKTWPGKSRKCNELRVRMHKVIGLVFAPDRLFALT
jgi:hypothetical protein